MNWDRIQGDWQRFKVRAKQHWGKLSDDDLEASRGQRDVLAAKLIEAYALFKDDAERQLAEWQRSLDAIEAARAGSDATERSGTPVARH
jgi:uncharacterized protein YjbJ (UPF0337 family)